MRFEWPLVLLAALLVPVAVAAYVLVERRRSRYAIKFPNLDVLAAVVAEKPPRRGFIPPALFALALLAAVVAAARPELARSVPRKQATVVLVVDTSGSMVANDVRPSRLAAAQEAVRRFVGKLPGHFEVGMIAFSSEARIAMPISDDHHLALQSVEQFNAFGGTAIGDAIGRSLELLRRAERGTATGTGAAAGAATTRGAAPAAIVLLSDGAQNRGQLEPMEAALRAKNLKIPVYTVALGTPSGTIKISDGALSETLSVPPDPRTLKQIALETGGNFYAAANSARLNAVYEKLASRLSLRRDYRESTSIFVGASAVLLLGAGVASAFWLPRLP